MASQILLPSAQRNTAQTVKLPSWDGVGYHGVIIYLDITTVSGTGGLTLNLSYTDPVSGAVVTQAIGSQRTATGLYVCEVGPINGLSTLNGGSLVAFLPANSSITIAVGDASNYTYSLSFEPIP